MIRPPGPVPVIVARSIPRSLASLRTAGVAAIFSGEAGASTADGGATGSSFPSATSNVTNGEPTGTASPTAPCSDDDAPGERRRDLDRGLRGLHLDERLVQRDLVAGRDQPRDDLALLQTLAEVGHREHALGHQYFTVRRTASAMRSTLGR